LNSGPKLDLTSATLAISTFVEETFGSDEHPASKHTAAVASTTFNTVANLPNGRCSAS
jgi:hypothetical protein